MSEGRSGVGLRIVTGLLKTLVWAVVIAVPLVGVWAGSSLAVYWDGPIWTALVAGLCAFPLLPLAWEGVAAARRARKEKPSKRYLTFSDRLVIRTFVLNFTFLAGFLALWPVPVFEALTSRGDWMLEGREDPTSETLREGLLGTADWFVWLYDAAAADNPYEQDDPTPLPTPEPTEVVRSDPTAPEPPPPPSAPNQPAPEPEEPHARAARARGDGPPAWPLPAVPHPLVAQLPAEASSSIESVGRYVAEHEPDPYLRVKALHDYVADHVAYDAPILRRPRSEWPGQDAETTFRSGRSVCAGYANLMVALGEASGDHIVYISGHSRDENDEISGAGHAWNAVQIEGRWYLMDATWDAGSVNGDRFEKRYSSDNLFTPPEIFSLNHFPRDEEWQLREEPLSRGEFIRQPRLKPRFFRAGFSLVSPDRAHVTAHRAFVARIDNPAGHFAMASIRPHQSRAEGEHCEVDNGPRIEVRCPLPRDGVFDVMVFESPTQYATYWDVASFQVAAAR